MSRSIEAFAAYHGKKEFLTDYMQVTSAGLTLLRRNIDVPNAPALLGSLVDACGIKYWGKGKNYKDAAETVNIGLTQLAEQGVIQHVSAFYLFSRSIIQDVARFSTRARNDNAVLDHDHSLLKLSPAGRWVSEHCCNDLVGRLDTLSHRLEELEQWIGWVPSAKLVQSVPLFELIGSIRNTIAHNDEIVGASLEELAGSRAVAAALVAFRRDYARRDLPRLPTFIRGRPLQLGAVHSILFGAFLYEIAKELNAHAIALLDDGEFIDMAFCYSCIVDEHPFRTIRHRSAENRVSYFLAHRYLREVTAPGTDAIIRRLSTQQLPSANDETLRTLWQVALARHLTLLAA